VTNYHTVNGQFIGESAAGVRTDYMVDALGSVTGTVNQSAQVVNTYRYKPYGALLAKTGTGADPKMGWVGTLGYRGTGRRQSDYYVRARHYGSVRGRWTTVDPLWPGEATYTYAQASPVNWADTTGRAISPLGSGCPSCLADALTKVCDKLAKGFDMDKFTTCMSNGGYSKVQGWGELASCMRKHCDSKDTCVVCGTGYDPSKAGLDQAGDPGFPSGWPWMDCPVSPCRAKGQEGSGETPMPLPNSRASDGVARLLGTPCTPMTNKDELKCEAALRKAYPGCSALIIICQNFPFYGGSCGWEETITYLHELVHACTRLEHNKSQGVAFFKRVEFCMCQQLYPNEECNLLLGEHKWS